MLLPWFKLNLLLSWSTCVKYRREKVFKCHDSTYTKNIKKKHDIEHKEVELDILNFYFGQLV